MTIENRWACRMSLSVTILDQWMNPEQTKKFTIVAQKEAITDATRLTGWLLNILAFHTFPHFEYELPSHAPLQTWYSSCWLLGYIISHPSYNLYSHRPNKGEQQSKFLVCLFEYITKKGVMSGIMVTLSQQGIIYWSYSKAPHLATNRWI